MILSECFQVDPGHLLVLAVEFVEFKHRVRLTQWIRRVVGELVRLAMPLYPYFIAFLAIAMVAALTTVDSYHKDQQC